MQDLTASICFLEEVFPCLKLYFVCVVCVVMKVILLKLQVHVTGPSSKRVGEQIASELCCWFVMMKYKEGCTFFFHLFFMILPLHFVLPVFLLSIQINHKLYIGFVCFV